MSIYNLKHIETPRLRIRPVQAGDELEINAAINKSLPALQRWMPWAKDPSLKTTREFVERVVIGWNSGDSIEFPMVVIHKEHNKIISASGFNEKSDLTKPFFEVGYWIDSNFQGQGLITEVVNALTRYALSSLKATRVQLSMQIDNEKSIAVAKRLGFKEELIMKNYSIDCLSSQPADSFMFSCCDVSSLPALEVSWENELLQPESKSETQKIKLSDDPQSLPELSTQRLKLKPPTIQDAHVSYNALLSSVDEVGPWFSRAKSSLTEEELQHHINDGVKAAQDIRAHDHLFYLVWDREREVLLGEVWAKINDWTEPPYITINYWFDTRHTGQGYATEAVAELTRYALQDLNARRVQLHISETNSKSIRIAEKIGYVHEGTLANRSRNFVTGEVSNMEVFSITSLNQLHAASPESFNIRSATNLDVKNMVALSEIKRSDYEKAESVFWKKAQDAEIQQEQYFNKIVNDEEYISFIAEKNGNIIGFIIGQIVNAPEVYNPGGLTCIIDDFCTEFDQQQVGDELFKSLMSDAKDKGAIQVIVVCGNHDIKKRAFLDDIGCHVVSNWFYKEII